MASNTGFTEKEKDLDFKDLEIGRSAEGVQKHAVHVSLKNADEGAKAVEGITHLDEDEAQRIRKKIDWNLMPLMMVLYFIQVRTSWCRFMSQREALTHLYRDCCSSVTRRAWEIQPSSG
jgi:hypothetical protein